APEARAELDRIRRRWSELPARSAADAAPLVRALVIDLAARTVGPADGEPDRASSAGLETSTDLQPAVVTDQLAVVVWDAYAFGCADGIPERLTTLRRALP
ncbi:MAG: hypothetical protein ACRCZP_15785, partial [Phycicoccus sp.]